MATVAAAPVKTPKPAHIPDSLVVDFDYIHDEGIIRGPHARMREIANTTPPLFWTPYYGGHWVARGRDALAEVATHPETFSSKSRGIPPVDHEVNLIPLTMDPPVHSSYRIPINPHVSVRAVALLEGAVRDMTNALIDGVIDKGGCEFLHEVAEPLPVVLFFRLCGMPTDRLAEFRLLAEQATADPDAAVRAQAFHKIGEILAPIVKSRMEKQEDDLISKLYAGGVDGRLMSFEELLNYSVLLFLGGLETVVNALCFTTHNLATHPELQAKLRADPSQIPEAVEEFLRLHGIAFTVRRAVKDTTVGDAHIKADEHVMLMPPAANYDPKYYEDSANFCPGRQTPHVTFNMGPHRCMGANLARLELRVFLEQWLSRVPSFRLDPDKAPVFFGGLNLAVRSLNLKWN